MREEIARRSPNQREQGQKAEEKTQEAKRRRRMIGKFERELKARASDDRGRKANKSTRLIFT